MYGTYKRCTKCNKIEHHKRSIDTLCDKCTCEKKKEDAQKSPNQRKERTLF